jgi:membrane protein implicated in regulation of membrane protease activity
MFSVYLFATIVGWPFVLFFLFFGSDVDADADVDFDAEVDVDLEADSDVSAVAGAGSGVADVVLSILSFRSLVFLLAFFGTTGLVLRALGVSGAPTFVLALAMGLFAGYLNARLYAYLKRSSVSTDISDAALRGSRARVVLPVSGDRKGRIEVDVDGQPVFVTALPFDDRHGASFEPGERVVVVDIDHGTALISRLELDD